MTAVEERVRQDLLDYDPRAAFAAGARSCQGSLGVFSLRYGANIGEIDINQTRPSQQAVDGADGLGDESVGNSKSINEAGVFVDQSKDLLVSQANHRIGR